MAKTRDLLALAMAQAILGACGRVVGASLGGTSVRHTTDGDEASLVPGKDSGSHIDIDFFPSVERLALNMRFEASGVPDADSENLAKLASVRLDGLPLGDARPADGPQDLTQLPLADALLTVDMVALLNLEPGKLTSIRIATTGFSEADGDSALLVSASAAMKTSNYTAIDDFETITRIGETVIDLTANDTSPGASPIFIIAINGQDVEIGDSVTLPTGQTITLLDDGTVSFTSDGTFETFDFTYTAAYGRGNAQQIDSALVTIDTIPCFTSGTMILTGTGARAVEALSVGELVRTRDAGLQPIRWIGRRRVKAEGAMAPIHIAKNALGEHDSLSVSPLHRVLVRNAAAEILYGTHELLVAARDLIDGKGVTRVEGGWVEYIHILFDAHHVIWSAGLETESFLPGPQTANCFEAEMVAEITAIFPQLDPATGAGFGPSARPTLKPFEAKLLVA